MSPGPVVVQGRIRPDGTLELNQPVGLPPGEVQVTVEPVAAGTKPKEDLLTVMKRIRDAQRARGYKPRTREEIDADIAAIRNEAEERMRAIEQIHDECRPSGEQPDGREERAG
jgi:hypothetical protein